MLSAESMGPQRRPQDRPAAPPADKPPAVGRALARRRAPRRSFEHRRRRGPAAPALRPGARARLRHPITTPGTTRTPSAVPPGRPSRARCLEVTGHPTKELITDRVMLEAARLLGFTDRQRQRGHVRDRLRRPALLLARVQAPSRRGADRLPRAPTRPIALRARTSPYIGDRMPYAVPGRWASSVVNGGFSPLRHVWSARIRRGRVRAGAPRGGDVRRSGAGSAGRAQARAQALRRAAVRRPPSREAVVAFLRRDRRARPAGAAPAAGWRSAATSRACSTSWACAAAGRLFKYFTGPDVHRVLAVGRGVVRDPSRSPTSSPELDRRRHVARPSTTASRTGCPRTYRTRSTRSRTTERWDLVVAHTRHFLPDPDRPRATSRSSTPTGTCTRRFYAAVESATCSPAAWWSWPRTARGSDPQPLRADDPRGRRRAPSWSIRARTSAL